VKFNSLPGLYKLEPEVGKRRDSGSETIRAGVLKCGKISRPVARAISQDQRGVVIRVLVL
jgi:hypothetical protein